MIKYTWDLPGLGSQEIGFAICNQCGLVLQSPSLDFAKTAAYYTNTATYANSGRNGKPSLKRQKDVKRLINTFFKVVPEIPPFVFQIGCSDGYTLSEFHKAGASVVEGIDPSIASHKVAKEINNIDTIIGTFEKFIPQRKYDLLILTHILEHLYNPLQAMNKCCNMQRGDGWILIEVPLFQRIDRFPPGLFTLEHLNYFSESTLLRLLYLTGYAPYLIEKLFYNNIYPVIAIIAKKEKARSIRLSSDFDRAKTLFVDYLEKNKILWKKIALRLKKELKKEKAIYIWGAGIHTSQLFAFTDIKKHFTIKGLLDSSNTKQGKRFGNFMCYSPGKANLRKGDTIIISSYASESEIYENLKKYREKGIKVIKFYGK